jgi:hypothetical protein
LIKKQMIERPSPRPVLFAGDRHLAGDEQPPSWFLGVDLIPGEEIRVIRQEFFKRVSESYADSSIAISLDSPSRR